MGGEDILCLVVLDASRKVIFDTYARKKYIGPERVFTALDAIFAKRPPLRSPPPGDDPRQGLKWAVPPCRKTAQVVDCPPE